MVCPWLFSDQNTELIIQTCYYSVICANYFLELYFDTLEFCIATSTHLERPNQYFKWLTNSYFC